jgi:hypothetical protein
MKKIFKNNAEDIQRLYSNNYINNANLFTYINFCIPHRNTIYSVDYLKAIKLFKETFAQEIKCNFSKSELYKGKKKYEIDDMIFVMNDDSVIGFEANYCDINTAKSDNKYIQLLAALMQKCRCRDRNKEFEINLITRGSLGLELTAMEIKKTNLNIDTSYNDDFAEVDKTIQKRLNTKKDKGIVLLHGLPGTGKTTYIRYLVGKIKKKILFLPPGIARHITDPDFVNILIENPNCVVIIEDAENIIMDRSITGDSSVSNLLNISDGLLADFLNVQLICTFNTHISKVDSALLRKGRLIAKYEFDKLSKDKAQVLSNTLGNTKTIEQAMTLSEIYNQDEAAIQIENKTTTIGFRRHNMELVN